MPAKPFKVTETIEQFLIEQGWTPPSVTLPEMTKVTEALTEPVQATTPIPATPVAPTLPKATVEPFQAFVAPTKRERIAPGGVLQ